MKTLSQDLLATATQRLVAEFQPEQVWLFGSHAWGTPHHDSDVDFLVIVPQSSESPVRRMQRAHHCLGDLAMSKDVFVQTRAEFDRYRNLPASLQHRILERGRRLHG